MGKEIYSGVANVGLRPTIGRPDDKLLLEVHILDFGRMIYGRILKTEFLKRIRGERKFKNKEALQRRILQDISAVRHYFAK